MTTSSGRKLAVDHAIPGGPSVLFDAVVVAPGKAGLPDLIRNGPAKDFCRDAHAHLKVIGFDANGAELMRAAGVTPVPNDEGHISLDTKSAVAKYIATAKKHKIWAREPSVSPNV
ncbi:MAG: hypothetical protein IPK60_04945 [Sandaracinaceae bacterium]|nr:hypothetical protein [Sandaracinaceae bacterium]